MGPEIFDKRKKPSKAEQLEGNVAAGKERLGQNAEYIAGWLMSQGIDGTNEQQLRNWLTAQGVLDEDQVPYQSYAVKLIRPLLLQKLEASNPKALDKKTRKAIAASDDKVDEVVRDFRNPNWRQKINQIKQEKISRAQKREKTERAMRQVNVERGDMLQKILLVKLETVVNLAWLQEAYRKQLNSQNVRRGLQPAFMEKVNFVQALMQAMYQRAQQKLPHQARFFTENTQAIQRIIEQHLGIAQTDEGGGEATITIKGLQAEYEVRKTVVEYLDELLNPQLGQEPPPLEFAL